MNRCGRPRVRQPVLFALVLTNIVFTLAAVAPRFADTYWLLEIPGHFRAHLSVVVAAIVLVFAALGAWRHVLFGTVTTALVAAPVVALWVPSGPAEQPGTALRALSLNVSFYSRNYAEVLALIEAMRPDVVGLVEINSRWMEDLAPLGQHYAHRVAYARPRGSGVALFSRIPFRDAEVRPFPGTGRHYAIGTLEIDAVLLVLAVGHATSPLGGQSSAAARDRQLATLADARREFADRETLLMGDFNTSPWSLAFRRFLSRSGLRDAARGFGYRPTWPAQRPWLGIPIDHHMVSDGIVVNSFSVVGPTGSDHLAVYTELVFR